MCQSPPNPNWRAIPFGYLQLPSCPEAVTSINFPNWFGSKGSQLYTYVNGCFSNTIIRVSRANRLPALDIRAILHKTESITAFADKLYLTQHKISTTHAKTSKTYHLELRHSTSQTSHSQQLVNVTRHCGIKYLSRTGAFFANSESFTAFNWEAVPQSLLASHINVI